MKLSLIASQSFSIEVEPARDIVPERSAAAASSVASASPEAVSSTVSSVVSSVASAVSAVSALAV